MPVLSVEPRALSGWLSLDPDDVLELPAPALLRRAWRLCRELDCDSSMLLPERVGSLGTLPVLPGELLPVDPLPEEPLPEEPLPEEPLPEASRMVPVRVSEPFIPELERLRARVSSDEPAPVARPVPSSVPPLVVPLPVPLVVPLPLLVPLP